MSRVLICGDLHIPFEHKDYLKFCKSVYKKYRCNRVVMIGDIIDSHAISYHETDVNGMSAGEELELSKERIKPWVKAFPKAYVTLGNHDLLIKRKAQTHGLPIDLFKPMAELYGTPKWDWVQGVEIDGVWYTHTGGGSGKTAHIRAMETHRTSIVQGHAHSAAGIGFSASYKDLLFAMNVGCGISPESYAFAYGKGFAARPILSCGVVINGTQPYLIPMKLGDK